jgi:hypothetical protein
VPARLSPSTGRHLKTTRETSQTRAPAHSCRSPFWKYLKDTRLCLPISRGADNWVRVYSWSLSFSRITTGRGRRVTTVLRTSPFFERPAPAIHDSGAARAATVGGPGNGPGSGTGNGGNGGSGSDNGGGNSDGGQGKGNGGANAKETATVEVGTAAVAVTTGMGTEMATGMGRAEAATGMGIPAKLNNR